MSQQTLSSLIWSVADLLRGDFKQSEYGRVILPFTVLRRLDCAFLNWYLERIAQKDEPYDSVRCGFVEGKPVFEGSGIMEQSHVQLAIRNPSCIVGLFRPNMDK